MLKFINGNRTLSLKKLEKTLSKRKFVQKNQASLVREILINVKKYGDKSVIKYEKKFSKIKFKTKKIKFTKNEISKISKY